MPKIPYTSISSLLNGWIIKYYEELQENPKIRASHETHLEAIEALNKRYLNNLSWHQMQDIIEKAEDYDKLFTRHIDFLTGVYTKEEKLNARKRLRDQLKAIPNRHYKP